MSSQAAKLKKLMKTTIRDMARNQAQFTRTPGRDFTRKRKLDFASVVSILLSMSGGSTTNSLMDYFKFDPNTASTSAFVQQRAKLKPEAMEYLFQRFVRGSPVKKTFRGYRLLAVDGSDLRIFADPNDPESYYPGANGQQPYSLLHLNALFDLENQIYTDAFIHKSRGLNEHKALIEMLDRATIQLRTGATTRTSASLLFRPRKATRARRSRCRMSGRMIPPGKPCWKERRPSPSNSRKGRQAARPSPSRPEASSAPSGCRTGSPSPDAGCTTPASASSSRPRTPRERRRP